MKVMMIGEATMRGLPAWAIHFDDGTVVLQRRQTAAATETPMDHHEQLVCELCEFAKRGGRDGP